MEGRDIMAAAQEPGARSSTRPSASGSGVELFSVGAEDVDEAICSMRSVDPQMASPYWHEEDDFDLKKAVSFYLKSKEANDQEAVLSISNRTGFSMRAARSRSAQEAFSLESESQFGHPSGHESGHQSVEQIDLNYTRTQFKSHAWANGILLHFKKRSIDLAFMNEFSVLHKKDMLAGYCISVLLAAVLVLLDNLFFMYETRLCGAPTEMYRDSKFYCETLFGPRTSDRRNVFNFSMLFSMVVLNACGIAANVLIHRSVSVWNKAWGLVVANAIYVTEIVLVIVLIVNLHSGDNFWPLKLMMWYMLLVMCSMWLTGLIFAQNLVVFLTCVIVYYSCTFGVASEMQLNSGNNVIAELDSLLTTSLYAGTSHFLLFIHLAMLSSSYMNEKASRKRFFQRLVITYQQDKIIQEKGKQEKLQKKLLFNMLPKSIVGKLEMGLKISQRHQGVCILFAELEGFAAFSSQVHPSGVMEYLNDLFQVFDGLCDSYDVYKVETVGDQYVAAVGVVTGCMHNEEVDAEGDSRGGSMDWESSLHASSASNTQQMIGFAKAIMKGFQLVSLPESEVSPALRIGIHTGPCMSGIVGTKSLRFCLFGDTMNTAARMEQKGTAACVHTTQDVVDLVPGERWEKLAKMEVKGKGSMQTYLLRLGSGSS